MPELLAADDMGITWLLIQDGLLPKMEGVLGKVQLRDSGLPGIAASIAHSFSALSFLIIYIHSSLQPGGHKVIHCKSNPWLCC